LNNIRFQSKINTLQLILFQNNVRLVYDINY
jgi:hypothetical protein